MSRRLRLGRRFLLLTAAASISPSGRWRPSDLPAVRARARLAADRSRAPAKHGGRERSARALACIHGPCACAHARARPRRVAVRAPSVSGHCICGRGVSSYCSLCAQRPVFFFCFSFFLNGFFFFPLSPTVSFPRFARALQRNAPRHTSGPRARFSVTRVPATARVRSTRTRSRPRRTCSITRRNTRRRQNGTFINVRGRRPRSRSSGPVKRQRCDCVARARVRRRVIFRKKYTRRSCRRRRRRRSTGCVRGRFWLLVCFRSVCFTFLLFSLRRPVVKLVKTPESPRRKLCPVRPGLDYRYAKFNVYLFIIVIV